MDKEKVDKICKTLLIIFHLQLKIQELLNKMSLKINSHPHSSLILCIKVALKIKKRLIAIQTIIMLRKNKKLIENNLINLFKVSIIHLSTQILKVNKYFIMISIWLKKQDHLLQ